MASSGSSPTQPEMAIPMFQKRFRIRGKGSGVLPQDGLHDPEAAAGVTADGQATPRRCVESAGGGSAAAAAAAVVLIDLEDETEAFRTSVSHATGVASSAAAVGAVSALAAGAGSAAVAKPSKPSRKRTAAALAPRTAGMTAPLSTSEAASTSSSSSSSMQMVAYTPRAHRAAAPIAETQAESSDDGVEERWFLGMSSKIVGVQHYNGVVSDRESVLLRRQPNNPYDRNAIQVLNMRSEQIGHIPREMAAVLSPVMDSMRQAAGGEELRIEGHIPRGAGNVYSCPLRLQVFGHDPRGSLAPRMSQLGERLERTYCAAARGSVEVMRSPEAAGTPVTSLDNQMWRDIMGGKAPRKVAAQGPTIADVLERELESIFRDGASSYESSRLAEQPEGLQTKLYPHQLKALHWMMHHERNVTVEDVLAEQGQQEVQVPPPAKKKRKSAGSPASLPSTQIFFWTKEVKAGGPTVYRNLATNAAFRSPPRLPKGGILADDMGLGKTITTLALILSDTASAPKVNGPNLIVCPLSVLFNWAEQLRLHAPGLRVRLYHGPDRDKETSRFRAFDVTLTTYDIVRADSKEQMSGLAAAKWHRVVLDEAHVVKNHKTATAKSVFETLNAERKWCLTGTPIMNSVEDLYSITKFLKLEPFDSWDWFNRTIVRPLKNRDTVGLERLQVLLRTWCLRRTKDMKIVDAETGLARPLLMLPQKTVEVVRVPLDPADRVLYDRLLNCVSQRVKGLEEGGLGENFVQLLALLTRLRQLCCDRSLVPQALLAELKSGKGGAERVLEAATAVLGAAKVDHLLKTLAEAQEDDCSICMEPGSDVVTRCGHVFHRSCIELSIKELGRGGSAPCPLCRGQINKAELLEKPDQLDITEDAGEGTDEGSGAKIRAVMAFLAKNIVGQNDPHLGKPHKAVVFSQFTSLLDLLQREIKKLKMPFARLDGSMPHEQRVQALQNFGAHGHIQIMLCSLKAAGTGLNLTVADHVLLVDPWWNPMVEDQAVDRLHRLGQRRPVRALRFVAERSVEERILDVQKQKRALVEGALSKKSREELQQLRLDMVASIFEPFVDKR
eukprot:TRINITY_DN24769_c1_g3_i1.p1 TRINITY_DN24769_c1_g3~~TRINITY_DN24769_c1_g3_i1.p1  ORF type:complete len:1067 (-),score=226.70 TRINITY_DN24769_c1_g3_i1:152-3352(-)